MPKDFSETRGVYRGDLAFQSQIYFCIHSSSTLLRIAMSLLLERTRVTGARVRPHL